MNSPVSRAPDSPERLTNESARAYRAFCVYRDLGPDRSLDRAWERFCATSDPGQDRGSARRPGHWAAWSQKYEWVKRAETYDDILEQERLTARAERRRELRDRRSKFELEGQQKTEDLVRTMDSALEKMATFTETIQVKHDKVNDRTITHKVTALTGRDYAAVVKQRNETMELATRDVSDLPELETEERQVTRIVWRRNVDPNPDVQVPESGQRNRQPKADWDTEPADWENDKAA